MTTEGKIAEKDAKFYMLYQGECLVEKRLLVGIKSPYQSQPIAYDLKFIHIAKIGNNHLF